MIEHVAPGIKFQAIGHAVRRRRAPCVAAAILALASLSCRSCPRGPEDLAPLLEDLRRMKIDVQEQLARDLPEELRFALRHLSLKVTSTELLGAAVLLDPCVEEADFQAFVDRYTRVYEEVIPYLPPDLE